MNALDREVIAAASQSVRVVVVGDLLVDETLLGNVDRLAPEGPVPLVSLTGMARQAGGAANVIENLALLGARVVPVGVVGADDEGAWLRRRLRNRVEADAGILVDASRSTPLKRRVIADGRILMRLDLEVATPLRPQLEDELIASARIAIREAAVLLISDYGKGAVSPRVARELIQLARSRGIPVLVDPKGASYEHYRGATVLTPNRKELELVTARAAQSISAAASLGEELRKQLELEAMVVKLSSDGMLLLRRGAAPEHIEARTREVFDVTGAGDTVLALLGAGLGAGVDYSTAARLANTAAGVAVSRAGTVAVGWADVLGAMVENRVDKVIEAPYLAALSAAMYRGRRRIVFTNGCFDLLHGGHIQLLVQARARGDVLVVGLNSDASIRRNKGPARPVVAQSERARVLSAIQAVDFIVIFDEATPENLIRALKPHVLVKGADYAEEAVIGASLVRSYGGEVMLVPLHPGCSTTAVVSRIRGSEVMLAEAREHARRAVVDVSRHVAGGSVDFELAQAVLTDDVAALASLPTQREDAT